MPDSFGNPTPQEVQQQILQQQQAKLSAAFANNPSGFGKAGVGIGNALGGLFSKNKKDPRVERAEKLKESTGIAESVFEQQAPIIGAERARAQAMRVMSIQLRHNNMNSEATNLTLQADKIDQAEDARVRGVEDAKVASAQARETLERTDTPGIVDLLDEKARIQAQIETEGASRALTERLRVINQAIAKDVTITGRTEGDLEVDNLVTPTDPTINALQKSLGDSGDQLDLVTSIGDNFKPEFLTIQGKTLNAARAGLEKIGITLPAEQKRALSEFSEFRRNSLDGLNRYIKLITGAQMSEAEANRLRKAFPDAENDSPTQFLSKYRGAVKQLLASRRRAEASLREEGLNLLPSDFDEGFGAPLSEFAPSDEFVDELLGFGPGVTGPVETDEAVSAADALIQSLN